MAKRSDRNLLVGLDIGTSKVVAIVGEVKADGALEIIGIGSHPSRGLKKGVVVNIESTVQSIQRAVEEAELMAGCEIHSVYAGIAGSHVRSLNSHGIVAIAYGDRTPIERGHKAARPFTRALLVDFAGGSFEAGEGNEQCPLETRGRGRHTRGSVPPAWPRRSPFRSALPPGRDSRAPAPRRTVRRNRGQRPNVSPSGVGGP